MHGGMSTGAPKGNQNAFKHGLYSGEALAMKAVMRVMGRNHKDMMENIWVAKAAKPALD